MRRSNWPEDDQQAAIGKPRGRYLQDRLRQPNWEGEQLITGDEDKGKEFLQQAVEKERHRQDAWLGQGQNDRGNACQRLAPSTIAACSTLRGSICTL